MSLFPAQFSNSAGFVSTGQLFNSRSAPTPYAVSAIGLSEGVGCCDMCANAAAVDGKLYAGGSLRRLRPPPAAS